MKFNPGDVISTNVPLVHALKDNSKNELCDYCFVSGQKLKHCGGCGKMHYCGRACQRTDWEKHKYECKIYAQHYASLDDSVRFTLRLWFFLTKHPESASKKYSLQYDPSIGRSYEDLMTHSEDIANDVVKMQAFASICTKFTKLGISFDKSKLFENGRGLYVAESMFEHSCTPNAAMVFNGVQVEIRCMKPIEENETITINWVDLRESKGERQKTLKESYYFDCKCRRCEEDLPRGFDYEQLKEDFALIRLCIIHEQFEVALHIGLKTLDRIFLLYDNQPHPDLTVWMVRMFKLHSSFSIGPDSVDKDLLTKTKEMMKITHPKDAFETNTLIY